MNQEHKKGEQKVDGKPPRGDKNVKEGEAGTRTRGDRGDQRGGRFGRDGRGGKPGNRSRPNPQEPPEWVPVTKLGRLVKAGIIESLDTIFQYGIPIKEHQIVDRFLPTIKDEVLKIASVQKQTRAGQRTRFKAFIVVGDMAGHVGLGVKCSKEVATAIRAAIVIAKLSIVPVRRGYWGNKIGAVHTVPSKVTGKCGSVTVRLVPAPRGSGIVAAKVPRKILSYAGVEDVFTQSQGSTRTLGNFATATFNALKKTYGFLSPDLWPATEYIPTPFELNSEWLSTVKESEKKTV